MGRTTKKKTKTKIILFWIKKQLKTIKKDGFYVFIVLSTKKKKKKKKTIFVTCINACNSFILLCTASSILNIQNITINDKKNKIKRIFELCAYQYVGIIIICCSVQYFIFVIYWQIQHNNKIYDNNFFWIRFHHITLIYNIKVANWLAEVVSLE